MALESLWVFWKQHGRRAGQATAALLLFAAGWQTGRVMSPYYTASPIVFQESPATPPGANTGSVKELTSLQEQIAGTATTSPKPSTRESTPPATSGLFVGSKNSNLYHHKDCPSAKQIKNANQIWWPDAESAEAAGYSPSKCTQNKV